jgi:NAD(P)-dependent dehydrogenase (short-subunit alcohol dehydrogenase family)
MDNVLVVGASSGIGRAVALKLREHYHVFGMGRRLERLKELDGVEAVPFDVTKLEAITPMLKTLAKTYGKFRSVVYCAGVQSLKPVRIFKPDEMQALFAVNTYAPFFFAKAFAARSVHDAQANPTVVFVSSIAGEKSEKGIIPYAASKAALNSLTAGLALELAPIRVNAVAPGFLQTEMTERFAHVYDDDFIERVRCEYPLGLGTPEDVADLIDFLLSERARYLTGEVIRIDGGGAL